MKDSRYNALKSLIENGSINRLSQIFEYVPLLLIYTDLGFNYTRFKKYIQSPGLFSINDLQKLANLIGVDGRVITDLVWADLNVINKKKPR